VFHVKHEGWPEDLSREAAALLDRYVDLLRRFALPRGLIAASDERQLRERHVDDALRGLASLTGGDRVVDMGSGAGLPGIPIAIAAPSLDVVLAEARRTRIAFLELAVDELGLRNVSVHADRVERLPREFDAALARGFGSAGATWEFARAVLTDAGRLIYWAGVSFDPSVDVPGDVRIDLNEGSDLESQGPIVIMTRQ